MTISNPNRNIELYRLRTLFRLRLSVRYKYKRTYQKRRRSFDFKKKDNVIISFLYAYVIFASIFNILDMFDTPSYSR